ncbi:MAG: sensor histidine kinase [Cyclonatronaceae bacterium]
MAGIFRSFYARIAGLFLVLLVLMGAIMLTLSVNSVVRYMDESEQKLNRDLAAHLAAEFEPLVQDTIDTDQLRDKINQMMGINPRIQIYLLDNDGHIKASFCPPDKKVEKTSVDPEPLQRFLTNSELPILGDNPLKPDNRKPFSAAKLEIMGESGCYLYVILGNERYDSMFAVVRNSYIMQSTVMIIALTVVFTGIVGLVLFRVLTSRIREMNDVVNSVIGGDYNKRININSTDEIGELARSFNHMTDTVQANLEALQQVDKQRRELVANISHDLRSPLASVQGYLETLTMMGDRLTGQQKEHYIQIVINNTRKLARLVSELFELSKLDAEQVRPRFESFCIAELVQDLVLQYKPDAAKKNIRLLAELPENLPAVYADIELVERAISNLIDNAIQYTPDGGEVHITPVNSSDYVKIEVRDTGNGISVEDLPHIFNRFYRADKSRSNTDGTGAGLGLAIAKKILELHGSDLSVSSQLNKGTSFSFNLKTAAD